MQTLAGTKKLTAETKKGAVGAKAMKAGDDTPGALSFLAALVGATAILIMGAGTLKAEEEGSTPAVVAQIPLPLARPVQPDEITLTGVGVIAQKYALFQSAASEAMGSSLGTPREIRRLLDKLRFSEPQSVAQGWLAHRGLIAAADPAFADGVRRALAQHGPISMAAQLNGQGRFARNLPGANSAVAAIMSQIEADNDLLSKLRAHFLSAAQTFQGTRWGMIDKPAVSRTVDFANAGDVGGKTPLATQITTPLEILSPISPAHAYASPLMERVLAYGARHLMATSLETDIQASDLAPPTKRATSCLNWAQLNLNQCIAAAHFPSEEAWCTATHAIEDVRACWARVLPNTD